MLSGGREKKLCAAVIGLLAFSAAARAQSLTLEDVIAQARQRSVAALSARSEFVSDYWAWRSYQASRLPSLSLYGNVGNFDRSLRLLQNYETGELQYTSNFNMQNSIGLRARQNITLTGGTLYLYSDLSRLDQFGSFAGHSWYTQPLSLTYNQPLFAYNQYKWDKRIAPKEYEKAQRKYLESMEEVTLTAVGLYYGVMLAKMVYDNALQNYDNTLTMLQVARRRLTIGSVTRDECLQLELHSLNDSLAINESKVSLQERRMQLNSLLGYDESFELDPVIVESLPDIVMDYDFVLAKCEENSSFYLQNSINILNADSAIEKAKADRGITMQLNATFGLSNTSQELSQTYKNVLDQEVVGLSFSIPIFDWGLGKGKVRKAEASAQVVKAEVRQAENDKRISLFTAVEQFNNQRQLCSISRRASRIASERYGLVMENFRGGKASVTDLNTARSESDQALSKYIGDLRDYWTYYYTLRKLTLYDFIKGEDISVSFDELLD